MVINVQTYYKVYESQFEDIRRSQCLDFVLQRKDPSIMTSDRLGQIMHTYKRYVQGFAPLSKQIIAGIRYSTEQYSMFWTGMP